MARVEHLRLSMTALSNSSFVTYKAFPGALQNLQVINFLREQHPKHYPDGQARYRILDLLINCHIAKCSEPRDRIYALLSAAPDA